MCYLPRAVREPPLRLAVGELIAWWGVGPNVAGLARGEDADEQDHDSEQGDGEPDESEWAHFSE